MEDSDSVPVDRPFVWEMELEIGGKVRIEGWKEESQEIE